MHSGRSRSPAKHSMGQLIRPTSTLAACASGIATTRSLPRLCAADLEQMGGENVCALHLRASCWYEQQGNITEAVEHAFNAGAWERAADLLESKPRTHPLGTPEGQMIARWVEKLPAEVVHSWPQLGQLTTRDLMKPGKSSVDELWSQTAKAEVLARPR